MALLCCEANCSSADSPAVSGGGRVGEGRGVAAPETGTTEDGKAGGTQGGGRGRTIRQFPCHIVHYIDILRIVCKQLSGSETLRVSTHAVIVVPELECH